MISSYSGWVILLITYLLTIIFCKRYHDRKLLFSLVLVISFYHLAAIINAYVTTIPSASLDAATYHQLAVHIAENKPVLVDFSSYFYAHVLLASSYKIFGSSLFLGDELSVFAFTLSCFIFIRICHRLEYSKEIPILILLYGLLPSVIIFCSITMKESWQILFFMLTADFLLKNLFFNQLQDLFFGFMSASILCLLHIGFFIYIFALSFLLIIFHAKQIQIKKIYTNKVHILSIFSIVIIMLSIVFLLKEYKNDLPGVIVFLYPFVDGHALQTIQQYVNNAISFPQRTVYTPPYSNTSIVYFIKFFLLNYLHFMFSPAPWKISTPRDFLPFLDSCIRLALIILIATAWKKITKHKNIFYFLLCNYLLVSIIWSLGTFNYGTSFRHQILVYWILVIMFGMWLKTRRNRQNICHDKTLE